MELKTLELATGIVRKLVREGYIAYFAGGWVRDFLMGHPSEDIDIATNASPEQVLDIFPHTILVGLAFGVVIVSVEGHQFEVASFRRDIEYQNGRKPERIELCSPEEDALRRDFTINGMFYDPLEDKIYDYVHGLEDLKQGLIRTIGEAQERFTEDRLRMIRAVRFASRFGFFISLDTQEGIIENADTLFPAVAMERIWQEFNKMALYPRFDHAVVELHRLGLLPVIFPQLQHVHLKDIKNRVESFGHFQKGTPTIVYLMELFPYAELQELLDICLYLRVSGKEMKLVEFLFKSRKLLQNEDVEKVDRARFYAHPHSQLSLDIFSVRYLPEVRQQFYQTHQQLQEELFVHIERMRSKKPLITGAILEAQGIFPGKQMGMLMKEAESLIVNYDLNDLDEVLALLQKSINWPIN